MNDEPHNNWLHRSKNWAHWSWEGQFPDRKTAEEQAAQLEIKDGEVVTLPVGMVPTGQA
jgi:hypothetical protein